MKAAFAAGTATDSRARGACARMGLPGACALASGPAMNTPNDFYPTLRRAIALAREAGLGDEADALASRAFVAFTTGSEALGETGLAILEFRARAGPRLPDEVARLLDACQTEIGKVWPRLRPGWQGALRRALARFGIG